MAKTRKKGKKSPTRRRSVGSALSLTANSPLVTYGSIAIGYFFGAKINEKLATAIGDKIDGKIIAGAQVGLGALLVFGKSKGKKNMLQVVGGGFALGMGIRKALTEFGLVSGIGGYSRVPALAGYGAVPALGRRGVRGYSPSPSLNGVGSYNPNRVFPNNRASVMGNAAASGGRM